MSGDKQQINGLDSKEWGNESSEPIDEHIIGKDLNRSHGPVFYPGQSQRNQGNDDERIEDDGTQDGARGGMESHDV